MIEEDAMGTTNFLPQNCAVDPLIGAEIHQTMSEFHPELGVFTDEKEFRTLHVQWRLAAPFVRFHFDS